LTNIWAATRDYERKLAARRNNRAQLPALFAETPAQRRAAMARLREQYPAIFGPVPRETTEVSPEEFPALVERYRREKPAPLSDLALRLAGRHPR
jgi:hypothetical protein